MGVFPDPGTSNETRTYSKGFVGRRTSRLTSLEGTYMLAQPKHTNAYEYTCAFKYIRTHVYTYILSYIYGVAFGELQSRVRTRVALTDGGGVIDVRAKSLIPPLLSIRQNDERLSAINRESRSFFRQIRGWIFLSYNEYRITDSFAMFLVDCASEAIFSSSRIVISLVAIFIIDEFDKMFIRNFI